MTRDAPAPLFHPFETGDLALPVEGACAIWFGASPGMRPPRDFLAVLDCVQGFRPDYLALQRAGLNVSPTPTSDGYDLALVLAGRHRGQNEMWLVEAIERTRPGGMVLCAGGKTDGVTSLRKRLAKDDLVAGHLAKNHGEVFWLMTAAEERQSAALLEPIPTPNPSPQGGGGFASIAAKSPSSLRGGVRGGGIVAGRFHTAPGMFSHDRIDAGSKLVAQHLPSNLKGAAADFCAGWGYLSVTLAERCPGIMSIDLFEADHASLEAAKQNMTALAPNMPADFHWIDLAAEKVERRFDLVVMNPPFHQGRAADPGIGHAVIRAASNALKPGGQLFMVANRGLPYAPVLKAGFARVEELADEAGFWVWKARR
ncbi:MAG: class I SAM-dependent methyltransferase [Rhizobiaceae bacterium]